MVVSEIEPAAMQHVKDELKQLTHICDLAGLAYFCMDAKTKSLKWAPSTFHMHGVKVEEDGPTIDNALELYRKSDRKRFLSALSKEANGDDPEVCELTLIDSSKPQKVLKSTISKTLDESAEVQSYVGFFEPVEDR